MAPRRALALATLLLGGVLGLCTLAGILALLWVGTGPEVYVVPGAQLTHPQRRTLDRLGLLEPDEPVLEFYSDAMVDIRDGLYLVTDRAVVLYDDDWSPPAQRLAFADIARVDFHRDTSFGVDSQLVLTLRDGSARTFPVSSTHDGDLRFVAVISRGTGLDIAPVTAGRGP